MEVVKTESTTVGEPVSGVVAPQPQQPTDNRVPYERLKEVVDEKNALKQEVAQMKQMMNGIQQAVSPTQSVPSINTIEDLVKYADQRIEQGISERAKYFEQALAPIQQDRMVEGYTKSVESYFASDPEANQVRAEMDAYTATLPPQVKQQLIQSVLAGDRLTLDGIKYQVMKQRQNQIQGAVGQNVYQQAQQAQAPSPFRTVRNDQANPQAAFDRAKKGEGSYADFFGALPPLSK